MKIAIIGTGYVGIVTAVCLADSGNQVMCVDVDEDKIADLRKGQLFLYEPGLPAVFQRVLKKKRISFTDNLGKAVLFADIIFIALPTPANEDGSSDLQYVLGIADEVGRLMTSYKIIVNKSTVPVGTVGLVSAEIAAHYNGSFDVISNPEFLREGNALFDFMKPDRIVIGTSSERAANVMKNLYTPFVHQGNSILIMDAESAEMTKYAANSFLATKISFMNELAMLCEKVGANIDHIRRGIGLDERIGRSFLYAGIGYGGSCFPKDVCSLRYTASKVQSPAKIINAVHDVNQHNLVSFVNKIDTYFGSLSNKVVGIWGLSFKPNTDDIRESCALKVIDHLLTRKITVRVFDPEAMDNVKEKYGNKLVYATSAMNTINNADALVITTEWREFVISDFSQLYTQMKQHVIFDGRNIFDIEKMRNERFDYISIGRPSINNRAS